VTSSAATAADLSRARLTSRRGIRHTALARPTTIASIAFLLTIVLVALVAPIILPDTGKQLAGDLLHIRQGPSGRHLLGTDTLGRDVLDRLLVGTRVTIVAAAEALLVNAVLAIPLGLVAGYMGGRVDRLVGWLTDLSLATPVLIIILVVVTVIPRSTTAAMITIGIVNVPSIARVIRSATLPVREELYIAAARVSGLSRPYIISRHILPRIQGVVIVQYALFAAACILAEAGLAFLGVVGNPSAPSWGAMVADGISVIQLDPWLLWPPGIAIGLTVLALTLLGDALRDTRTEAWSASTMPRRGRMRIKTRVAPSYLASDALLSIEHLTVAAPSDGGPVKIVDDVTFGVRSGEVVGLVGESGCGKTMTAMAVLGLLPGAVRVQGGAVRLDGRELTGMSARELRRVRGKQIALISQEPMISLTPTFRVGFQIAQLVRLHQRVSRRTAQERAVELLRRVQLPEPEVVARRYPHELSGGMAQRVAIARALAGEPKLLIADEPTTALDVTIQAEVLDLLRDLQQDRDLAILLVTHDWGVIADLCDRAVVMYAGEVVEQSRLTPIFGQPLHPYTKALLAANPHNASDSPRLPAIPGNVPAPGAWPQGCRFHPRCGFATSACRSAPITIERPTADRETRCIHHELLAAR
jgi:peptide/nickel transport system permease protein